MSLTCSVEHRYHVLIHLGHIIQGQLSAFFAVIFARACARYIRHIGLFSVRTCSGLTSSISLCGKTLRPDVYSPESKLRFPSLFIISSCTWIFPIQCFARPRRTDFSPSSFFTLLSALTTFLSAFFTSFLCNYTSSKAVFQVVLETVHHGCVFLSPFVPS